MPSPSSENLRSPGSLAPSPSGTLLNERQVVSGGDIDELKQLKSDFQPHQFGTLGNYRQHSDRLADESHMDMVTGMKQGLDNLLIFAALFSAVNAGILVYWLPQLSIAPTQETNNLLRLLVQRLDNTTLSPSDLAPLSFAPSASDVRVNQYLSISLTISLLASFKILLAQQWVANLKKGSYGGQDKSRWRRQRTLDGVERWHLETIVNVVLPGAMQIALIIFMVGLIDLLGSLSSSVALPSQILACIGASALVLSLAFSVWDPYCPFQASILSPILSHLHTRVSPTSTHVASQFLTAFPRQPRGIEELEAKSICVTLETSEDDDSLLSNASNIPLLTDPSAVRIISGNGAAMSRLISHYEAASSQRQVGRGSMAKDAAITYSQAIAHLLVAGGSPEDIPPRALELLDTGASVFNVAATSYVEDPKNPISLLPSSVATVIIMLLTPNWEPQAASGRYLEFMHSVFDRSPRSANFIVTGMLAWYLQTLALTRSESPWTYSIPGLRIPLYGSGMSEGEAVRYVAGAYSVFSRLKPNNGQTPLSALRPLLTQAFEVYRTQIIGDQRPDWDTRRHLIDQVVCTAIGGLRSIFPPSSSWSDASQVIHTIAPLFASEPRPPLPREQAPRRDRVCEEALDLMDDVLGCIPPTSLLAVPMASTDMPVLTLYMKTLVRHCHDTTPRKVLQLYRHAPGLCELTDSSLGVTDVVLEGFKNSWAAVVASGRFMAPGVVDR